MPAAIPRDARLISLILGSCGLTDIQPAVLLQLLEFAHRYTTDVLSDALVFADHAAARQGGTVLTMDDVTLAIQARSNYSFTKPPQKDVLLALATGVNAVPLPPVSDRHGVRIPEAPNALTQVNFQVVPNSLGREDEEQQPQQPEQDADVSMQQDEPEERGTKRSLDEDEDYD